MNKKLLLAAALTMGISCSVGALAACDGSSSGGSDGGATDGIFTVTFQTNGGTTVESVEVVSGESIDLNDYITENSDENYYFNGWYLDEDCTERATTQFYPSSDVTLYARWITNEQYTLTFDSCGGSAVASQVYYSYEYLSEPEDPTREGYLFDGWYWDEAYTKEFVFEGNTMITQDVTIYAKWIELYVLTFETNGGGAIDSITGEEGTAVSAPADPVREGYVFEGWYSDAACTQLYEFTVLTEDVTVYAGWRAIQTGISVTLNINSGSYVTTETLGNFTEGDELEASSVAEEFEEEVNSLLELNSSNDHIYIFNGWSYDAEGTLPFEGTVTYTSSGSIELYAQWIMSAMYCRLTFTGGDGELEIIVPKAENLSESVIAQIEQYYGAEISNFTAQDGTEYNLSSDVFVRNLVLSPSVELTDFVFTLNSAGYTLTSYTGSDSTVVVPSSYNGVSVTAIGAEAFLNNSTITSLSLPDSITSIGERAFMGCSSLSNIECGDYISFIGIDAFSQTAFEGYVSGGLVYLSSSLRALIGYSGSVASVTIPSSVKVIAEGALAGNTTVTSVVFAGNSISAIPNSMFRGCVNLSSVSLPSSNLVTIGDYAFEGCSSLRTVSLPSSVTSVGSHAFENCSSLSSISFTNVLTFGEYALANCAFTTIDWTGYTISSISEGLFSGCTVLTSVVLPESTASIGAAAFKNCVQLTFFTVNAPDNPLLTSIGAEAFSGCSSLRTVILFAQLSGDNAVSLGEDVFADCASDLVVFISGGTPAYDYTSQWYDSEQDAMLSYIDIYSQLYPDIEFAVTDLTAPTIKAEQNAIMLTLSEVAQPTDVISILLLNGLSATDNATASEDIAFSVSSIVHVTTQASTEIEASSDGLYDLSSLGVYYVTVSAADRFGNSSITVITIAVVN